MFPIPNLAEIRPVGPHTDACWRTDMQKLIGAFRDYANVAKIAFYKDQDTGFQSSLVRD